MSVPKLPKQWLYWARGMRLKPKHLRWSHSGYYLEGRGRHWRINAQGHFQISAPLDDFDRWANSVAASLPTIPRTEAQFRDAIRELIRLSSNESTVPKSGGGQP